MWNEGYTSEIGYTYGCYRELSPFYQEYALTLAGFESVAKPKNRFLELGVRTRLIVVNPHGNIWRRVLGKRF